MDDIPFAMLVAQKAAEQKQQQQQQLEPQVEEADAGPAPAAQVQPQEPAQPASQAAVSRDVGQPLQQPLLPMKEEPAQEHMHETEQQPPQQQQEQQQQQANVEEQQLPPLLEQQHQQHQQQQPEPQQPQLTVISSSKAKRKSARAPPQFEAGILPSKRRRSEPKRLSEEYTQHPTTEDTSDVEEGGEEHTKEDGAEEEEEDRGGKKEAATGVRAKRQRLTRPAPQTQSNRGSRRRATGAAADHEATPEPATASAGVGPAAGPDGAPASLQKRAKAPRQGGAAKEAPQTAATPAPPPPPPAASAGASKRQNSQRLQDGKSNTELTTVDKLEMLQQTLQEYDAARAQVETAGSVLQHLVDLLFQEPFSNIAKHRELIKSIQSLGKRKEDDTFKRLKTSATDLFQIWKQMNHDLKGGMKENETAAGYRQLHPPEAPGTEAAVAAAAGRPLQKASPAPAGKAADGGALAALLAKQPPLAAAAAAAAGRVKSEEPQACAVPATAPSTTPRAPAGAPEDNKQEAGAAANQGPGQPGAGPSHPTFHHPPHAAAATGSVMPNGCAVAPNTVLLSGFSSTGDVTRDAAVSLLAACLEEPVALRTPVEVALEAEGHLYDRFAEASYGAAGGDALQKAPGVAYKSHLHALWCMLSDADAEVELSSSCRGVQTPSLQGIANGNEGAGSIGEVTRRALLEGLFTPKQLLDSAFN